MQLSSVDACILHVGSVHYIINDTQCGKNVLMPYSNSGGIDERAHPSSLIWTFFVRRHIPQYPSILLADNAGPDQSVHLHNYIRTLFMRRASNVLFAQAD